MFTIKRGEKYPIYIKLKNVDEDKPIDLTNSQLLFQLKDELKDDFFVLDKCVTETSDVYTDGRITDPINGEAIIKINDEDWDKLITERVYYLIMTWVKPDEDFVKVISSNCDGCLQFKVCYP